MTESTKSSQPQRVGHRVPPLSEMAENQLCAACCHVHSRSGPCPGISTGASFAAARAGDHGSSKKMDVGKPPIVQGFFGYFARAIVAVSYVSEYGDRKYAAPEGPHYTTGWQEVPDGEKRYADADGRHRVKVPVQGDYDDESEIAHLAHKAWNALAELEIALKSGRVECRQGNQLQGMQPILGTFKKVVL